MWGKTHIIKEKKEKNMRNDDFRSRMIKKSPLIENKRGTLKEKQDKGANKVSIFI